MLKTDVSTSIYKEYLPVARDEFDRLDLSPDGPVVWEDLDGHNGSYRNRDTDLRPCLLAAQNDWEAVAEFLATAPKSPQTFRSYQKECLRLSQSLSVGFGGHRLKHLDNGGLSVFAKRISGSRVLIRGR